LSSGATLQDDHLILQKEAGTVVCTFKATHSPGDALFQFILEGETFGRSCLPVARQFSPALRPSNNFADTKTPKTSAMELKRRMCTCFSSLLLAFVSLVLFLCFRCSSRLQSSSDSTSGLPASQKIPRHLE